MSQFQDVRAAYAGSWKRRSVFVPLYMALRLLTVAIIAPGVAAAIDLAVSLSDQSALTDQDIAMFILSPVGFLATLAAVSLFLVGEVIGFSVMTASIRAQSPSIWQAGAAGLSLVIVRARSLIEFAARFVLKVLVLVAPFVVVAGAIAWWTLTEYDINYYLTFKPPSYWVAVVLIGAILLCMVWVLIRRLSGWSLALHLVLFDASRPSEAFGESETRMQGRRGKLKISLVLWLGVRLLLAGIIASVAGLAIGIVPFGDQGNLRIALRLTFAIVVIWSLAGIVLAAVALGALAVLLDGFFDGPVQVPEPRSRRNLRPTLMVCVAGAAGLTMASIWMGNQVLEQIETDHEVAVIGHRGAAAARPENTMASVLKAIEDGADWVEIDVQETADDVIVVMHDSDYMKLAGVNLKIWDATMADLQDIDIGSWFDPAYGGERTPTLSDVLAASQGKAKVLIELKYYGHDVDLENRVIALVEEMGMADDVAVMSLKYPAVQKMLELRPDWRVGVLAATAIGNLAGLDGDFIAVSTGLARPGLIRSVQDSGKDFYVWTVNDPLQMSKMISMGVDGLITDEPALVRKVIDIRNTLSPAERLLLWVTHELDVGLDPDEGRDDSP